MGGCISACNGSKGLNAELENLRRENLGNQLMRLDSSALVEPRDLLDLTINKILYEHSNCVRVVAFSQDNKWLASGSDDRTVFLYNLIKQTENKILEGHTSYILSIAFSNDSKWLVSSGEDGKVHLWNLISPKNNRTIVDHVGSVLCVTFSADNKWLASGGSDTIIRLWNIKDKDNKQYLNGHSGSILTLSFSSDIKWLASSSVDSTIRLWDLKNFQNNKILNGHCKSVLSINFSTDSYWLASGSMDNTLRLWCISSCKNSKIINSDNNVYNVLFSSNNCWLVYCSGDKLYLYFLEDSTKNQILEGHNNYISSIAVSQDNLWLASASKDSTIKLWDLTNPINNYTLKGHNLSVNSIFFSQNGRWLVSGGADNTVRLWELNLYKVTGEALATYKSNNSQNNLISNLDKNSEASYDIVQSPIKRIISSSIKDSSTLAFKDDSQSCPIFEEIGDKLEMSISIGAQHSTGRSLEYPLDSSNSQSSPMLTSGKNSESSWGIIDSSTKRAGSFKAKHRLSSITEQKLSSDLENMSINEDEKQNIERLAETSTALFFSSVHVTEDKLTKTESKKGKEKQMIPIGKFTKIVPL
jgi:WD40 repeat protein